MKRAPSVEERAGTEKKVYRSYEELPPMLTVPEAAAVLSVSRAGAYDLAHNEGFPVLKIVAGS